MNVRMRVATACTAVVVVVAIGVGLSSRPDPRHVATTPVPTGTVVMPPASPDTGTPAPDELEELHAMVDRLERQRAAEVAYVNDLLAAARAEEEAQARASIVPEPYASGAPAAPSGGVFPSDEWIIALGRCEQPGDGPHGIWITSEGTYPGGFGFLPGAYDRVKDPEWPARMSQASLAQQMEAVRRLGAIEGFVARVWSCINTIGPAY